MQQEDFFRIIYPHNQKFLLRRAHDVLVMRTCHALASHGHQVHLLMGKTSNRAEDILAYYGLTPIPTLHLIQLPILRRERPWKFSWHGVFNFFCWMAISRLIKKDAVDLIYITEMKLAHFLFNRGLHESLPFVYEVHGLLAPDYARPNPVERHVFRRSNMLTTTTGSLQNVAQKLYAPLPPMVRVPLAADIEEGIRPFFPPEPHEPWRVGYVGQLYPLQGVDLLIKALSLLPERVCLDVIGGKDAHIDALRTLARERGVEHRTRFHGFLPPCEVASRAAQVHILAAPSLALGKMPFVAHTKIYEYLAWGRPIVAADLPSIREEIADGTNGLLFEAGNVQSLARAILKIMSHPDLAGTLVHNGLAHAGEYSWDKRTLKLEDCFRRVLNHGRLGQHSGDK